MERIHTTNYVSYGLNNASFMRGKNFIQSVWNRYTGGNFLRRPSMFLSRMSNPLSVTLVNDDLIRPASEFMEKSSMQEKTSIDIRRRINKLIYETMQPVTRVDPSIKADRPNILSFDFGDINKMHDEDLIIENFTHINIMNSVVGKDESTIESHSVSNVHENEKLNNISNNSCPTEISLQKSTDTDKDTSDMDKEFISNDVDINIDAKSFLIVSHSDVPELVQPIKTTPVPARWSVICQDVWNRLTNRFYDFKMNSMNSEMSIKRPSYLSKRFCRRRANAIAMGRGRGRARCQLRRSGVSQTRHRKERTKHDLTMIIKVDYELYENDEIQYYTKQNNLTLNDKSANLNDVDGYDIPDGALFMKRTSPVILSSSDVTPTKRKPQMPKNQEIVKHPTRMHYVDSSTKSTKDCETSDIEKNVCQLQATSVDSEVEEYTSEIYDTIDFWKTNEDCSTGKYDTHNNLLRMRFLSESSVDSEDSFIIFENESPKNQEVKYPRVRYVVDPLTKINSYHKDSSSKTSNIQKNTLRSRLLSESSSADSEDSFVVFETSNDESSKQGAEDPIGIHDVFNFSTKINNHCKDYNSKLYMHEDSLQFSENSEDTEDTEDSFCIVFNTKLEENCTTDNFDYIKTSIPTALNSSIEDESTIENNEDSEESNKIQMKKVSFAPTPIVHVMITWNYAYRAARKGQWEEMARDNERFKGRINSIAVVLNPILTSKHRSKVWQERFAFQEYNLPF